MRTLRALVVLSSVLALTACGVGVGETVDESGLEMVTADESALTTGRFETFVGQDGQHYFHLLAGNGEKVLRSEGYTSYTGAKRGIDTVRKNGVLAERYYLREAVDGTWYLVLTGGNGAIIGVTEMYSSKANAERAQGMLVRVMENAASGALEAQAGARFEIFKGLDSKWYFHLRARNGEIMLQSQAYTTKSGATSGVNTVRSNGAYTERFTVLEAADGKHYFVLKAGNGRTIGWGETYSSKSGATKGVEAVIRTLTVDDAR